MSGSSVDEDTELHDLLQFAGAAAATHHASCVERLGELHALSVRLETIGGDGDASVLKAEVDRLRRAVRSVVKGILKELKAGKASARGRGKEQQKAKTSARANLLAQSKRAASKLEAFTSRADALAAAASQQHRTDAADQARQEPQALLHPDPAGHNANVLFDQSEAAHVLRRCATCEAAKRR